MPLVDLSPREIKAILAALENYELDSINEDLDHVYWDGDLDGPLTDDETNRLREKLNRAP